jgi:hypothetical protein
VPTPAPEQASNTALVVGPSTAKHGPIPLTLMLAKSVTFAPQLRGTLACARSPRRDQAYWGVREVLVPISSTKTKRSGLVAAATITRQAALKNSSLSLAPTDLFFESIPGA